MNRMAFTPVLADRKSGRFVDSLKPWTLGIAEEGVGGYTPVKETGEPSDPFYVAPYPTRFDTREEANAEAERLNERYFHIDAREASKIVASSMTTPYTGGRVERCPTCNDPMERDADGVFCPRCQPSEAEMNAYGRAAMGDQ